MAKQVFASLGVHCSFGLWCALKCLTKWLSMAANLVTKIFTKLASYFCMSFSISHGTQFLIQLGGSVLLLKFK